MERRVSAARLAALLGPAAERAPAYLSIADGLRLLVTDRRIPPGTRLPSERELTVALGVSRTTVTRAYAHLRDQGFLASRQGSGSVAQLPSAATVERHACSTPSRAVRRRSTSPAPPRWRRSGCAAAYEAALAELPGHLPEYGYFPSGLPALREAIARRYDERGLPTTPDQVLVTSGALSALAIVTRAFVGAGDRVLMESPTYPNAIATLRGSGARVVGADIDQSGWATSSLVDAVRQVRPRSAYLMPDFHNPTGLLMTDRRARPARHRAPPRAVADRRRRDDGRDRDRRDADAAPVRRARRGHRGARLGEQGLLGRPADRLGPGTAAPDGRGGRRPAHSRPRRTGARAARPGAPDGAPRGGVRGPSRAARRLPGSARVDALATELPSWRFRLPAGGLSLWCELPRPASSALAAAARRLGVQLAPGPLFAPEGGLERYLRLPFTPSPETMTEAVGRIADAWAELPRRRGPSGSTRSATALVT